MLGFVRTADGYGSSVTLSGIRQHLCISDRFKLAFAPCCIRHRISRGACEHVSAYGFKSVIHRRNFVIFINRHYNGRRRHGFFNYNRYCFSVFVVSFIYVSVERHGIHNHVIVAYSSGIFNLRRRCPCRLMLIACNRRNRRFKFCRTAQGRLLRGIYAERGFYACAYTLGVRFAFPVRCCTVIQIIVIHICYVFKIRRRLHNCLNLRL